MNSILRFCRAVMVLLAGLAGLLVQQTSAVQGHVVGSQSGSNFVYAVFNDEPAGSPLTVSAFHLAVHAPVQILSIPVGWDVETDGATYVDWFCTNDVQPFATDIVAGTSLTNFVLTSAVGTTESLVCSIGAWDTNSAVASSNLVTAVTVPSILDYTPGMTNVVFGPQIVQFDVLGGPATPYEVQSTTNLLDWVPQTTNAPPYSFVDTTTNALTRVYRVVYRSDQE